MVGNDIVVVIRAIEGNRIRLGVEAPKSVRVLRGELTLNRNTAPQNLSHAVAINETTR